MFIIGSTIPLRPLRSYYALVDIREEFEALIGNVVNTTKKVKRLRKCTTIDNLYI